MDSRTMLRIVLFLWRMDYDTILNIVFFLFFTSGTASARLPESLAEVPSRLLFETHTESGSVMTWIADHVPVIVGLALALAVAVFLTCCWKAGPPTRIAEDFSDSNLVGKEYTRSSCWKAGPPTRIAEDFSDSNLVGKEYPRSLVTYSERDLAVATNEYSNANLVGQGQFGSVYRGHLEGNGIVAVKRLLKIDFTLFRTELSILLRLPPHANLVKLFGMCSDPDNQMIVFEYVPKGTLFSHLHENQGVERLYWTTRKKIARQVAEALRHLHEQANPPIIHRDVKSKNVLLGNDFSAKLADFGLAKLCPKNNGSTSTIHRCGTRGYVDPQYWNGGKCSPKSDVYSFGVLLLELITGKKAVNGDKDLVDCTQEDRLSRSKRMKIVDQSLADRNNEDELLKMINIANKCLKSNRDDRPSMAEVVNMIRRIKNVT